MNLDTKAVNDLIRIVQEWEAMNDLRFGQSLVVMLGMYDEPKDPIEWDLSFYDRLFYMSDAELVKVLKEST